MSITNIFQNPTYEQVLDNLPIESTEMKELWKQDVPQDKITRPRYMAPQRNKKDINPLQVEFFTIRK
jgi:hypothetical protein